MDELDRKIKHIWNKAGKPDSRMKKGHCPEDTIALFLYGWNAEQNG
ncbi:MAG: hypothetical protein KAJ10_14470 [Thermodesulfovibrionia bacterium]|nr:hypothetical protein [Thermodesulfovibrionia bacterium]